MAFDLLTYAKERKKETGSSTQQAPEQQGQFDLRDYALRKNAGNIAKSLSDRVNTWVQNHNNYIQNYQTRYSGRKFNYEDAYVSDADDWLDTVNKQRLNFQAEADSILSYLDKYKGYLDSDWAKEVQKALTESLQQQKSISAVASQDNDWWSNFKDETEYKTAGRYDGYSKKYSGKSYEELLQIMDSVENLEEKQWLTEFAPSVITKDYYSKRIAENESSLQQMETVLKEAKNIQGSIGMGGEDADSYLYSKLQEVLGSYGSVKNLEAQIEELKSSSWNMAQKEKYDFLRNNSDYAAQSKVKATEKTAGFGIGIGTSWLGKGDPVYDYINDLEGARTKNGGSALSGGTPYSIYDYMEPQEISDYNYLYNTEGKDAAKEYLEYLEYTLNARRTGTVKENAAKLADEHPVLSSVISVPANLMGGIGAMDIAGQNIVKGVKESVTGEYAGPVDYNRATMTPSAFSTTVRGTVSQNLIDNYGMIELDQNEHPILSKLLNGKSWADVYQLGMSMADSATIALMAPYVGTAGTYLLGGSAATQGILDAVERGATDGQALTMGILNGAFEVLFEKVSLENLLKGDTRSLVKAFLKQGFVEGTEELNTTLFNNIADILVMAEKSGYRKNIAAYMEQGLSEEEATKQALLDMAIQMGWDFVGGVASGGVMGTIASPINSAQQRYEEALQTYSGSQQELVDEALEINPDNAFAQRMQGRLGDGKDLSGRQLNRLVQQNEKALTAQDRSTIQTAAESRLTELGETGDVSAIAAALTKQAAGQKLSKTEIATIQNSKYGQRVANELNTENIKSGDFSSEWAQRLDTNRINVEEYSRLVEAAQLPQEGAKVAGEQVVPEIPKAALLAQAEPVQEPLATVPETRTVPQQTKQPASYQQVTEESPAAEAAEVGTVSLEDASKKYGAQAKAMIHTYQAGQDVAKFDKAYQAAYDMGKAGVNISYALKSESTSYLTDAQRGLAYEAGEAASNTAAHELDAKNKTAVNGKTGRKKGVVRGEGVTIADLKQTFNDTQGKAYKYLSTVAEVTGIDIVLYRSEAGPDGKFQGAQGRFSRSEPGTIYIDLNAGLSDIKGVDDLAKYAMLRTFAHEFTHFIEKWNPIQYNEFRKVIFDTLTQRGENVHDLIEDKQARNPGMSYDKASREVVAEAMTDILPDANFVQDLAENHKTIFQKLLEQLKEFVQNLRDYFNSIGYNSSKEANALKEQMGETVQYLDSIVRLFDKAAVEAVENYQQTVATEEVAVSKTENTTTVSETESVAAAEEVAPEVVAETSPTETDYGFTITGNETHGSLEIKFGSKPPQFVIDVLKAGRFRWHKAKQVWYGYAERDLMTAALNEAFAHAEKQAETVTKPADTVPEATDTVTETQEAVTEATAAETERVAEVGKTYDPNDPYERLAGLMGNRARFEHEGFIYRVLKAGPDNSMWQGRIDAADVSLSGVYVSNARGVHYTSELYENRDDAVEDVIATARASKLLDEETTKPNEEVTDNGENVDNQAAVQQPELDRGGTARLLDEAEAGDVPADGGSGNVVADTRERGQSAVRDGSEPGQRTGDVSGHGERSGQSGDLRGTDRVTGDVTDTNVSNKDAEKLHEEVTQQIEQQSTEKPKGRNFVIGDSLDLPNGEKARYKANVEAIRLVKQLEADGRYATEAEQVILSKYVGWGGLANAFDQRKTEWSKEFQELKGLLTDEEYASARGSTLNAHFTDISVIKAMYDGLKQLGFTGGRMMEPSSGVGNFVGAMPADMASQVRSWTMVELDGITGLIAKYLYPNADVRIQGFEKANVPNNFMDVAIGNVPFGNYAIADKNYPKKVTSAIHNYFFAKSLDKVRPGGIVMFITSSYTMNSKDNTVRRYIMQKADLLGAIRLPDNAFKGNAGTEVVTDILILKKRAANTAYAGEDFLEAPYQYISGYNGAYINSYFENHPEMVLGTASMEGGMYRGDNLTYKALEGKGSLADQIREAFKNIQGKMEYPAKLSPEKTNFAVERADKKTKENGLVVKDGKVYQNKNGELIEQTVPKGTAERVSGMLEIRDAAKALQNAQQQGLKDTEIKKARQKLNKLYDAFVKNHGFINAQANRNAIKGDPDNFSILALENWNPETKKAVKADIFSKNTIAPNRTVTAAKDVAEGLIVSVNQTGGVDAALIAKLTDKTEADVTRELLDSRKVFKNRDGGLETAEVYLSGNVRAKLRDAEALVSLDSDYQKNVEALKAIMPEDVGYQDIFVNPGTPWIPDSVYSDFAAHMLGTTNRDWRQAVTVTHNKDTGNFVVELKEKYLRTNSYNTQKWGTNRRSFMDLFDAMLNSKSVVVKYKTDDGKSVVDQDATAAANEKVEAIQKEFQEWLWKDEARRAELASLYNETFNSIVTPKYNGNNLTVNGANAVKPLRAHQRDAVQRIISSGGNTLLAHKVGAGKTYEMAAAAMKLKELGLVKKPLFAVPKSLVAQWGNEFVDFFPTAKLLVAEAGDFTAANRKIFANRIANGDYDAVIVSYEQFEKLPISADFAKNLYQEQIDSIIMAIEEAKAEKGGKSLSVKDLEKKRKSLETKIEKLTDSAKDEDNIEFEQLGVDSIFVDEAHNFKNLFYTTSMTNVSGLGNKDGSKRAFDLYTKVRYLQKLNGGRGIVFATATPVMNSMSEMYIMQKYLQPDLLDQLGLSTFDAWAKQFGEVVNGVEIKPSGQGYRVKQSFSRFKNMSELQLLFRNFADVLTDIPGLKIPKMKGGKVNVVVCEPGQFQQDYMKELEKRADNIKNVDPSVDNMLKITSDGRKISYTQRMIDPSLPYEDGCKIFRCADNVLAKYEESKDIKGTQIIFCDMATPKGKSSTASTETEEIETDMESAKLYDDIKGRLVKGGIPGKEIAFIHEADTDAKKKKLFADVNDGKVRVLIGSTGKMGVGMNAQKRIVAIHHLDAPWRPGDVEQRNGRAYRQGNINEEVENFTYVTEGSFDARLWDILDRKQNFINQVMNGENVGRETEDTGEVTLSAAEVKALASGSPLIMEQVQLDTDIKKLESLRRAHRSAVTNAISRLEADKGRIATLEKMIENGKVDTAARVDTYSEGKFSITIGNQKFTDKKDAGIALMAEATAKANEDGYTSIAQFAGFDLRVIKTAEGIKGLISGKQSYYFNTYASNTTYMINHLIARVEGISEAVTEWEQELVQTRKDMAEQEKLMAQPFAKQAELDKKRARYNEVMEILNPKEEQALDSVAEEGVQEQSRSYIDEDPYDTEGVHWGIAAGIMTKAEARKVWEAIANIEKRGYHYPITVSGEHIVSADNALFFVETDFRYPSVNKIIRFNEEYNVNAGYAKEMIIDARGNPARHREALRDVAHLYGEGYATEYDRQVYTADERENRGGKGKNRGRSDSGITEQGKQSLSNQESADLVAFHNITPELLLDVLRRKSLLMPSLAITNKGMTDFGEISLIFDKNTIDPAVNSENKLYGADAWTPTQTQLKKNAKFNADKTVNAVNTMKKHIGSQYVSELFDITPKQFKETIIRADGSIYDAYAYNIGVQTAYAMEQGILSEVPTNKNGTVDTAALQEQLNSALDTDNVWRQYKKWLNNISDTIITSYDKASNEDILTNMKAQPATAKQFKLSVGGELVVPASEYASIDDVRKNKNRLYENAAEATKAVAGEFLALANKIGNTKDVVNAINAAFTSRYSSSDIVRSFNQHGVKISTEIAREVQALYKKAVELPTQYFEAKPHRDVGLDEIKAAVLPNSSNMTELRGKLENLGIPIVEYTAGSNESRVKAINSVEDVQFQQRTNTLTDREVLALAASQVKTADLTAAEKDALDIFQKRLSKLETLQAERAEQGRLYKEQQFGTKVDRAKAAETLNRMHTLDSQIQKASADVLSVEEKVVLKRVLQKARTVVEQQERQHGQEILKRWRDRRNNAEAIKKYRDRLRADVDELTNWVLHPDNKDVVKHIPDALKNTVIPFLSSINFMSKRSLGGGNATVADKAFMEQARRLAKVMEGTVDIDEMYSNYTDLPPDFMQNLRRFMDSAQDIVDNNSGDFIINQMSSEELQNLSKVVRTLKKYIMQMNRFHVNAMFKHVYEAGENSIDFLAQMKPAENTGTVSNFLLWQQMRPAYAFERFGEGGQAIYDGLRKGQATLAFNTKKIQEFSEKAYTTAEVRNWENQVKTIRIGPGKTVTMRVSQIMSLYELNKREQAKGHIFGEGIRVATFKDGKKKISDVGQTLTPGELNLILRELTPRQKEVADKLQQFMQQQGGEWGNHVTVARFGEKQFGEENYFPINSDGRHLSVDADEKPGAAALYALLNMGFTKQIQEKAKNRLVVYSIFDVFANHMASMAQYNAFALPVVDALKWFNYQRVHIDEDGTKTLLGSVREQMDRAYGVPEENRPGSGRRGYAQNFVINIIKAFNGTEAQGTTYDSLGLQTLHHYNRAQVAYNFRVVVQQPLAITRAAQLLDYSSILKGMKLAPAEIQKNIREMQRYSGIAAWKSLGFYDVNISRGLTSLIKHDDTTLDKVIDFGMKGAEKADQWTWAAIWSAAKEEVIRKQKLTPKSEGFYEAVTKLFEDVIYKTQVVDSVLTKNEFMRDKGFFARAVGSFMSEPTTTASMLVDAYDKYQMDMQRGLSRQQAWKKNSKRIVRTAYVYGIGALVLAAVQAIADAFRDDDDYQGFLEKWLEAFGGNLVDEVAPVNKLPIVSDFYELAKELLSVVGVDTYGNPPQSVFMQWYDSLVKGTEIIYDRISGESTDYTWYGGAYKLLQAASGISGLPMASAVREIVTAWNNIVGAMAPSLKVKTYEPSEKAQIKYAYEDGYLTAEEAKQQLLEQNLVDTEDEAYWTIQGWEAGDGYSRYDAIFDAVRNGGDFNAAMQELTSHGYTEKDVLSQVKGQIGEWYKNGEITKQQATAMLSKYLDMGSEEITETVNKWSSKVVTGIAFEDIKDEYLSGNITAQRAIDMYVRYGGYTKDKATETVNHWRAEKETGVAYDDIKEAFFDGDLSAGDVKNMYITYGGLSEEKAEEKVAVLAFVKKYPDLDDITYDAVESYTEYCEAAGVPAKTYYDAWKHKNTLSGTVKEDMMVYINGLDLTYAQKDSLYYAFGWAASRIHEAPWH